MTYDTPLTLQACAKINLFLDITGRRPDGYHLLTGVMQSVSLADTVTISLSPADEDSVRLTCSDRALPTDRGNLAFRAAEAFLAHTRADGGRKTALRATVHIEKHIPYPAGLAGGSTDAAAVLRGLNRLAGEPLDAASLEVLGGKLGADVPFSIRGGACITEGVGDVLNPCPPLPDCDILIACAGEGVSTPEAYRALDAAYGGFAPEFCQPRTEQQNALLSALAHGDLSGIGAHMFNLFESVILPRHSTAAGLHAALTAAGACGVRMSGSGPSVFGLFARGGAGAAYRTLQSEGIPAWICHPVTASES